MVNHILTLEYHLVDSCNLNCAGCSHYSSLVNKPTYKTVEDVVNEFNLLKSKVGNKLVNLRLLGGEPLMHPQICDCIKAIRKLFPYTNISLVTNGLLLDKMSQEFYDTCLESNIRIRITDYGIIDLTTTINELKERGISADRYKVFADRNKTANLWDYQRIRLTEWKIDCFTKCRLKNICNNYRNGKIYLCPHIAYIGYFNKFFGKDIKVNETDYVSLEDVVSYEDLMEKLNSMKPNFCYQYCNNYDKTHPMKGKWGRTKKDINEFCLL